MHHFFAQTALILALAAAPTRAFAQSFELNLQGSCGQALLKKYELPLTREFMEIWRSQTWRLEQESKEWFPLSPADKFDIALTTRGFFGNRGDALNARTDLSPEKIRALFTQFTGLLFDSSRLDDNVLILVNNILDFLTKYQHLKLVLPYEDASRLFNTSRFVFESLRGSTRNRTLDDAFERLYVMSMDAKAASTVSTFIHLFSQQNKRAGLKNLEQLMRDPQTLNSVYGVVHMYFQRAPISEWMAFFVNVFDYHRANQWFGLSASTSQWLKEFHDLSMKQAFRAWWKGVRSIKVLQTGFPVGAYRSLVREFDTIISNGRLERLIARPESTEPSRIEDYAAIVHSTPSATHVLMRDAMNAFWSVRSEESKIYAQVYGQFFFMLDLLLAKGTEPSLAKEAQIRLVNYLEGHSSPAN